MSQFIKKNHLHNNDDQDHDIIDVISSSSRPQTPNIGKLENFDVGKQNTGSTYDNSTLKDQDFNKFYQNNTSIPDKIFQNYTFLPVNYKSIGKQNETDDDYDDYDVTKKSDNNGIIVNQTKNQDQTDLATVTGTGTGTFKSALDIYNPQTTTSMISKDFANAKELTSEELPETQDTMDTALIPITPQPLPSPNDQLNPLPSELLNSPLVYVTALTRLVKFLKYLIGKPDQRQPLPDPERQPLISPIESPINSPNSEYNGPGTGLEGPAYNLIGRYRQIFVGLTILLTLILLIILLITGDSQLLALIFRALLCYLLGDNAQRLLGQDFCPHYGWFWPWTS